MFQDSEGPHAMFGSLVWKGQDFTNIQTEFRVPGFLLGDTLQPVLEHARTGVVLKLCSNVSGRVLPIEDLDVFLSLLEGILGALFPELPQEGGSV